MEADKARERLQYQSMRVGDHLIWCGALTRKGYGSLWFDGEWMEAHRLAWLVEYGPIPPLPIQVNHTCHTPPCVEPEHLYLGDQGDNMDDMRRAGTRHYVRKTQCRHGHAYDKENTYTAPSGIRNCRACIRAAVKRYYRREVARRRVDFMSDEARAGLGVD